MLRKECLLGKLALMRMLLSQRGIEGFWQGRCALQDQKSESTKVLFATLLVLDLHVLLCVANMHAAHDGCMLACVSADLSKG